MKFYKNKGKILCEYDTIEDIFTLLRLSLSFRINLLTTTDDNKTIPVYYLSIGKRLNAGLVIDIDLNGKEFSCNRNQVIKYIVKLLNTTAGHIEVEIKSSDFYQYESLLSMLPTIKKEVVNSCLLIEQIADMYRLSLKDGDSITEIYFWNIKPYPLFVFKPEEFQINFNSSITSIEDLLM